MTKDDSAWEAVCGCHLNIATKTMAPNINRDSILVSIVAALATGNLVADKAIANFDIDIDLAACFGIKRTLPSGKSQRSLVG